MNIIRRIYNWMGSKVESRYADLWLVGLFFIESSFFIIPVDPLLIIYCVNNIKKSLYYAMISTVASVVGGLFGYFIGAFMWQTMGAWLVHWLISEKVFYDVVAKYAQYQHWIVLIAAFTPLPYKAITVSAGFCALSLMPFLLCSIIGRGARFFLVAGLIYVWGERIKLFIDNYLNYLAIVFVLLVGLSVKILL